MTNKTQPESTDPPKKYSPAYRPHHLITESDLFYLRSILRNLDELRQVSMTQVEAVGYGVANDALEDNRDWLDCFIAATMAESETTQWAARAVKLQRQIEARGPMEDTIFPIPLRRGVTVRIQGLPHDLTRAEAQKVGAVIMAYVGAKDA